MTVIIRIADVSRKTGLSNSTIYLMAGSGKFPTPIRLTKRTIGWKEELVDQWIAEREAAGYQVNRPPRERIEKALRNRALNRTARKATQQQGVAA